MKDGKEKRASKPLKLPNITSKTSSSFSSQTSASSRVRPQSSNKVGELEKNLFEQLNDYDGIDKRLVRKSKTRKQIDATTSKPESTDWVNLEAPYLKKLQKMMPQTYSKLLESRPLPEASKISMKKSASISNKEPEEKEKEKRAKEKVKEREKEKEEKRESSFTVAQREVQSIYQQYLEDEGLADITEITSQDLKQLNIQLNKTQKDINDLQKSMYDLIKILGNDCLNTQ